MDIQVLDKQNNIFTQTVKYVKKYDHLETLQEANLGTFILIAHCALL